MTLPLIAEWGYRLNGISNLESSFPIKRVLSTKKRDVVKVNEIKAIDQIGDPIPEVHLGGSI